MILNILNNSYIGGSYHINHTSIDGVPLKPVKEFCYLGSILANDALIDKEVENRISRASMSLAMMS